MRPSGEEKEVAAVVAQVAQEAEVRGATAAQECARQPNIFLRDACYERCIGSPFPRTGLLVLTASCISFTVMFVVP